MRRVMRVLPTFLVIGAQKAGTTALHTWLGRHPDAYMSEEKELNFFSVDEAYARGLDDYARHFAAGRDAVARGESSPSYAYWPLGPDVPARVRADLPDVRLVYLVRDPIARMRSNYQHNVSVGKERRPIDTALVEDERYTTITTYATQVERYLREFDSERLLVVCQEDLLAQDREALGRICRHVGLDPERLPQDLPARVHVTDLDHPWPARRLGLRRRSRQGELSPRARAVLADRLAPEVQRLRPWLPEGHDGWGLL